MELIFDCWDDVMALDILDWLIARGEKIACVQVVNNNLVVSFDSAELYAEAVLRWK